MDRRYVLLVTPFFQMKVSVWLLYLIYLHKVVIIVMEININLGGGHGAANTTLHISLLLWLPIINAVTANIYLSQVLTNNIMF